MGYVKVEGNAGLVRDMTTKAIINTNNTDYLNYINRKNSMMDQKTEMERQSAEINSIKNDLNEIKQLLIISLLNKQQEH